MRVVIVGAAGCGKTSLVRAILGMRFIDAQEATIGMCASQVPGMQEVEIWDTAGQERYAPLAELYWRDADIVIVAFDTLDERSKRITHNYMTTLDEHKQARKHRVLTLALWQTKSDIPANAYKDEFVKSYNFCIEHSAFTSAKQDPLHIRDMFTELVVHHRSKQPAKMASRVPNPEIAKNRCMPCV